MSKKLTELVNNVKQNKDTDVVKDLLHLVNKSWTEVDIEKIIQSLDVDSRGLLVYKGTGNLSSVRTQKQSFIPEGKNINIASTLTRCKRLRTELKTLKNEDLLSIESYNDFEERIQKIESALVLMAEKQDITDDIVRKGLENLETRKASAHGRLPVSDISVNNYIIKPLNEIYSFFSTKTMINKILTYRMAELLGNLAAEKANQLSVEALHKVIKDMLKTGTTGGSTTVKIDFIPETFYGFDNRTLQGNALQKIKITSKNGIETIKPTFRSVGGDVQQKADIEFEGNYISMKATSLKNLEYLPSFSEIPSITLQNSSLMLYLMGAQANWKDMGTHYLNILSKHTDTDGIYFNMRKQAERSLELYILYSALTGEGQLRKGKMANIFAVYETKSSIGKKEPRVKFFNTWDIINTIDKANGNGALFSPSISSLSFENTWIGHPGAALITNANTRISKILVEARNTQIKASISKQFLNNLYGAV